MPSDKVVDIKDARKRLRNLESTIKESSAIELRKEFDLTFDRLQADQQLIQKKIDGIEAGYDQRRQERYDKRVKEMMGVHQRDIQQAITYYKEQGDKDGSVVSSLSALEQNVTRLMQSERRQEVELLGGDVGLYFKLGHIKDVQMAVAKGKSAVALLKRPLEELSTERAHLEKKLAPLFKQSKREPLVNQIEQIQPKEEWLRDVLLPYVELYEQHTSGASLESIVQAKEQEIARAKEVSISVPEKEKSKSLEKDRGLEL